MITGSRASSERYLHCWPGATLKYATYSQLEFALKLVPFDCEGSYQLPNETVMLHKGAHEATITGKASRIMEQLTSLPL
jgi:hypothetical protein